MEALYRSLLDCKDSTIPWADLQAALRSCRDVHAATEDYRTAAATEKATLLKCDLWKQFHSNTNEMIVTKAGRRMFPLLQVTLSHLEPTAEYCLLLEFMPADNHRWRFLNGKWQQSGSAVMEGAGGNGGLCVYLHPTSPATGSQWMAETVSFTKLKLSNKENGNGKIRVNSLHKYLPCLHIVKLPPSGMGEGPLPHPSPTGLLHITSQPLPETQFIAVTAYQNDKITQMKIKHNPFAKAFLCCPDRDEHTRFSSDASVQQQQPSPDIQPAPPTSSRGAGLTVRTQWKHSSPQHSLPPPLISTAPVLPAASESVHTYEPREPVYLQQAQLLSAHDGDYICVQEPRLAVPSHAYPLQYSHTTAMTAPVRLSHFSPGSPTFQQAYLPPPQPSLHTTAPPTPHSPTYLLPHPASSYMYVTPLGYDH